MGKIRSTSENQDFLKVAKLNSELSDELYSLLEEEIRINDESIENTEKFIADMEEKLGVKVPETQIEKYPLILDKPVEDRSWDSLVEESELRYPQTLTFEDLLSPEEIADVNRNFDEINNEFNKKTKLQKLDWTFMATATALQCIRQYVIDPWLKSARVNASVDDEKGHKSKGDPGWYYVSTDKILKNRVPFDAQFYNPSNLSVHKFLAGAKDHRYVTLGHDPILGWIIGTANIMTSTITRYDMRTAHVKYKQKMMIHSLADTRKMAHSCFDRILHQGIDGKIAFGSAVVREAIHLKSDVNTKHSLPIPVISTVSPAFAEELARYGIDAAGVTNEFSWSVIINSLISMIHRLFYDESLESQQMYEVRTRKVLLYSNLLASSSNLIVSAICKDASKLDIGGLIVTIGRLFSDISFVTKVKQDFINSKLDIQFQGIESELHQLRDNKLMVSF